MPYVRKCNKGVQAGCPGAMMKDASTQVERCAPTYNRRKTDGQGPRYMTYHRLLEEVLWNRDATLDWCQKMGLIATEMACPRCDGAMKLAGDTAGGLDGIKWECYSRQEDEKRHKSQLPIRSKSSFERSTLSLGDTIKFTYLWSADFTQDQIRAQLSLSELSDVDWDRFCRETCEEALMSGAGEKQIGGPGKRVHIDESKTGERRYYRSGSHAEGRWVFGGLEAYSGKCILVAMDSEKRDEETLLPLIKRWIAPGTTIMSDCWVELSSALERNVYAHEAVNNLRRQKYPSSSYMAECLNRNAHRDQDMFASLISDIARVYMPDWKV